MKFLILCLLMYVGYRAVKALMLPGGSSTKREVSGASAEIDDVMVQDPFCETYFAQRRGVKAVIKGEPHYFCSTACRDKYLERMKGAHG